MLQFRPLASESVGTRPSTAGSVRDPRAQLAGAGVAAYDGSAGVWIAATAGESPVPWPRAKRSLIGFDCPRATPAAVVSASAQASTSNARVRRLRPLHK